MASPGMIRKVKIPTLWVIINLKVFAEFGEAAYDQQLLAFGSSVYFLVFQNPRITVRDKDRVETGG